MQSIPVITYPEAVKLLSDEYWGSSETLRQTIFESAKETRTCHVKGIYYHIIGIIPCGGVTPLEVPEGQQLALTV